MGQTAGPIAHRNIVFRMAGSPRPARCCSQFRQDKPVCWACQERHTTYCTLSVNKLLVNHFRLRNCGSAKVRNCSQRRHGGPITSLIYEVRIAKCERRIAYGCGCELLTVHCELSLWTDLSFGSMTEIGAASVENRAVVWKLGRINAEYAEEQRTQNNAKRELRKKASTVAAMVVM
jgi:hypothetical protein